MNASSNPISSGRLLIWLNKYLSQLWLSVPLNADLRLYYIAVVFRRMGFDEFSSQPGRIGRYLQHITSEWPNLLCWFALRGILKVSDRFTGSTAPTQSTTSVNKPPPPRKRPGFFARIFGCCGSGGKPAREQSIRESESELPTQPLVSSPALSNQIYPPFLLCVFAMANKGRAIERPNNSFWPCNTC